MKWLPASIAPASVLLLVPIWFGLAEAEEVRASRSETRTVDGSVHRTYAGSVRATFGGSRVESDSASVSPKTREYVFQQNVRFEDERYVVFADELLYDSTVPSATLKGNVRLSDGSRSLQAGRVTYREDRSTVAAAGDVRVSLKDSSGFLRADVWFQNVRTDSMSGSGHVRYTTSGPDTLTIVSGRVASVDNGILAFAEAVRLGQSVWTTLSATAIVSAGRDTVVLSGDVTMTRAGEGDSLVATSESALLSVEDEMLVGAILTGDVVVNTRANKGDSAVTVVRADTCAITLNGNDLQSLDASGSATLVVENSENAHSALDAGQLSIDMDANRPRRVIASGEAKMVHTSGDGETTARISGHGLSLGLDASVLESVRVDSVATCDIEGEHPTRLSGDRLELSFKDGKLSTSEVEGRVKGRYTPEEDAK